MHVVAGLLEVAHRIGLVRLQRIPQRAVTAHVRIPSGHKGAARGRAHRMLHVALIKARALCRQPIKVRRLRQRVAVAAQHVGAHFVGIYIDDVQGQPLSAISNLGGPC